jgi:hypothetical protein
MQAIRQCYSAGLRCTLSISPERTYTRTPCQTNDRCFSPKNVWFLLVDFQTGLGFAVESSPRQELLNNASALG